MKTLKSETRKVAGVTRNVIELSGDMRMDPAEHLLQARQNRARAGFLTGRTMAGVSLATSTQKFYDELIAGLTDGETLKKREALLARIAADPKGHDPELRKQLAGIRIETFGNYLLSPALWLSSFAEVVNLGNEENPVAQRITKQEINVVSVAGDGAPRQVKIDLSVDETIIPLGFLTTDIVRYRKVDVQRGRVVDPALATIKLAMDMGNRINNRVQNLLIGGGSAFFGPFVFTGKKANWTYNANSYINTANLPTSNNVICYEQNGTTKTTLFGFQVLANIVDYAARWKGCFEDNVDLRPTGRILLPPTHIKEIMNGVFPSGAKQNEIAEELQSAGWYSVSFLGVNWVFEPDNTLDPSVRRCYPEFNKKAVKIYFKPGMDEEKDSSGSYQHDLENIEERYARKVFGAYYDSSTRPYLARFDYSGT